MITLSHELEKSILDKFESRADEQGLKGKARAKAQIEFVLGAVSAIDSINGATDRTCATPNIVFSIMRGDYIKPVK